MNMINFDHSVLESNLPGLSVGLIMGDEIQEKYIGKMGAIFPYNQRIVQADLIYDIASLTKVIGTTTRILQLLQDGELKLTTQVVDILPEYSNLTITIADLLLHKSGLPADLADKSKLNLTLINQFYLNFNPIKNAPMCYSDLGFILLGIIIEKIDATDLETSFKNNIFSPFGMINTGYHLNIDKERYVPTEITLERGIIVGEAHDSKAYYLKKPLGSAGLFSSLNDLIHFSKILLSNQLPNQKQLFTENIYHDLKNYTLNQRTYGWSRVFGDNIIYHTGFTGTSIGLDLINKNGLILLTNRVHPSRNNQTYLDTRTALYHHFFASSAQRRA